MSNPEAEFLGIFRDETNERLDSIVEVLLALEAGREELDAISRLFRDAHTIKGAAGLLDQEPVRALAHALEDVLAVVRESGTFPPSLVKPLLAAADGLRDLVSGAAADQSGLIADLVAARSALESGTNGAPEHEPVPAEPEPAPAPEAPVVQVIPPEPKVEPLAPVQTASDRRTIRVPAEKLDRLLDLVGETVLHRRRLEHDLTGVGNGSSERVSDELGVGDRLLGDLQDAAISTRTLPLRSITGPFPRLVRDAAVAEGKEVELVVVGDDTELDRVILEGLSEPLVHVLRNSVAHGIEAPDERERAGKPRLGRVVLAAEQRGGLVAVSVTDDGRGVSGDVLELARREGSLVGVLARAGFSTRTEVSELAGRGVGLDAVKAHAEAVGGGLEIHSEPGRGTRVTLLVPLTLALLEVLLVERGPYIFGLPLTSVLEAVSVTDVLSLTGRTSLELRGETVPLADLADLVGGAAPPPRPRPPALLLGASGRRVAAVCDRLVGEHEVVVKSLGPLLEAVQGYLGGAILGDGRIALLLDPTSLVKAGSRKAKRVAESAAPAAQEPPKLLVVDDSVSIRQLQRSILEAAGYRVETATNGREALDRLADDAGIDLVVTDVEMPELDGLGLTRAIRELPDRSSLPVIVVTSRATDDDRRRGIEAGADAYMVKRAFDQQALLQTVERLVGR